MFCYRGASVNVMKNNPKGPLDEVLYIANCLIGSRCEGLLPQCQLRSSRGLQPLFQCECHEWQPLTFLENIRIVLYIIFPLNIYHIHSCFSPSFDTRCEMVGLELSNL